MSRSCPGHVQVMSRSCLVHLIPISISNLKVWTWSWLYNCNVTTHQETFLSEITQISLQKVNHWHKVRFRVTSEYAHWPTETLVPWSPLVTRYTGRQAKLPVVKMSWEEKSKKKPSVLTNFLFLINFIRHTGPMVTTGHLVHRQAISASSGQNELGKKF